MIEEMKTESVAPSAIPPATACKHPYGFIPFGCLVELYT